MNKSWFYLGAVSSLAIVMTSCGGDTDKKPATPAPSPSAAASPAPTATTATAPTPATPTPAKSANPATIAATPPVVPAKTPATKSVSIDVAAGLIPPTDADIWARTVAKGRPDPFAVLSLQPVEAALPKDLLGQPIQSKQTATTTKNSSNSGTTAKKSNSNPTSTTAKNSPAVQSGVNKPLPSIEIPAKIATKPTSVEPIKPDSGKTSPATKPSPKKDSPKIGVGGNSGSQPQNAPSNKKPTGSIKPVPQPTVVIKPLPQPVALKPVTQPLQTSTSASPTATKLAASVGVSGVIQVDGKTQVIVKLPNESFSRYVEVGDRIYDGKIKVKRVEGEQSLSPTIILEEGGVEVSRRIGDTAGAASPETQPK
jgi:hypothetical protein